MKTEDEIKSKLTRIRALKSQKAKSYEEMMRLLTKEETLMWVLEEHD